MKESDWQAEEEFGKKTPWDSVLKLEWVYKKAGKELPDVVSRRIAWQLAAINDYVRTLAVSTGELSINGLSGQKRGGGRGMLDLMLFKLDLLDELLINSADYVGLSADVKCQLRSAFSSHESYRNLHKSWADSLSMSAKTFGSLVEA